MSRLRENMVNLLMDIGNLESALTKIEGTRLKPYCKKTHHKGDPNIVMRKDHYMCAECGQIVLSDKEEKEMFLNAIMYEFTDEEIEEYLQRRKAKEK